MKLAVFDIGGTAVKTGIYEDNTLSQQDKFATPKDFAQLTAKMKALVDANDVDGVALSAPGVVDAAKGVIEGMSAVPYLHHRPIFKELTAALGKPIAIENDANCAGICEVKRGAGKDYQNIAFVVLGTGVGGAIFIDGQLYRGSHLFGGEFGMMKGADGKILSLKGTIVKAVEAYQQKHKDMKLDGEKLYQLAEDGDQLAKAVIAEVYDNLARALYNLQVEFDFDTFILGGGISARKDLAPAIAKRLKKQLDQFDLAFLMPAVKSCEYHNDANLYGAALNFLDVYAKQ